MDVVEVDAQGELHVPSATVTPQWLPGRGPGGTGPSDTGWIPLNADVQTLGSTDAPNLRGRFAVDEDLRTWWQPADGDAQPALTTRLLSAATIYAVRVAWRDVGLDATRGVPPGPFRYRIEVETAPGTWTTVIDRTASTDDLLIDYRECSPIVGTAARLVVTGVAEGHSPRRRRAHRVRRDRAHETLRPPPGLPADERPQRPSDFLSEIFYFTRLLHQHRMRFGRVRTAASHGRRRCV